MGEASSQATRVRASALTAGVVRALRAVRWYAKELMGENAYRHYLDAYAARHHGSTAGAMGEREFWRDVTDAQDRNPQARCC